ncbi:hypothetical protein M405DRAFT_824170 [Rhizopogon salebrosus TDB-379]|nr:hypothetical protein M405DRAFT_824170 [Rhizopogon salebrosus TDB-379]
MACIQDQNTYALKNARGKTVLDLSGRDNKSITGHHDHNGPNQSWIFQHGENGWFIKSAGSGQYLGIEGDIRDERNGTRVIAVSTPFRWRVEDSDIPNVEGIRILARDTSFSVDLSDHGNSMEGTKVQLYERWNGAVNQIWTVLNRNCVRAAANEGAGSDNEVSIVDDPAKTSMVTGWSKGIRKTKLASVVKDRGYSNESFSNPEEGQVALRELEASIKAWSAQGWRIGEDMRRLREFLYEDA